MNKGDDPKVMTMTTPFSKRPRTNPGAAAGSVSNQRMQAAGIRALDAYRAVARKCQVVNEELDDVTPVEGIPVEVSEESSLVTSIEAAIAENKK